MSALLKDLRAARALVVAGWVQGMFAGVQLDAEGTVVSTNVLAPDATCFCAWGAVRRAVGDKDMDSRLPAVKALAAAIPGDTDGIASRITRFNDAEGRTKEEVLAVFDAAITTELRSILTEALNGLKDSRESDWLGIRWNATKVLESEDNPGASAYPLVTKLSEGWPHHTGNADYPVPFGYEKWRDTQLELRLNLIEYLVSKISVTEGDELARLSRL